MSEISEIIEEQLQSGFLNAHGSYAFEQIAAGLRKKKTAKVLEYFYGQFFQDPIAWEDVKDRVWSTDREREENKYPFLQGDIIQTSAVVSLAQSRGMQKHDLWMVCSPTCDIPRGADYIRVAKIFRVDKSDIDSTKIDTPAYEDFKKLVLGVKFSSNKYFPIPPFPKDSADTFGYFADLVTPYYLERKNIGLGIPKYSLKFSAWHILNMFLMHSGTRSNPRDEPKIRCLAEGICEPNLSDFQVRIYHGNNQDNFFVLANQFSGQKHRDDLKDGDGFKGAWIRISENQEVYWFVKEGVDVASLISRYIT